MKKNIIIIAVFSIFWSCSQQGADSSEFTYTIDLDRAEQVQSIPYSEIFGGYKIIPLETDEGILLQNIDKILGDGSSVYVLDRMSGIIAKFDMDGCFVRRYGNIGRGAGEYISVYDFALDPASRRLYALDYQAQRILTYDMDTGGFEGEVRSDRQNNKLSLSLTSVGNLFYTDMNYTTSDKSNHMLRSFSKTDPSVEEYYLPQHIYLEGWGNDKSSLSQMNSFLYTPDNSYSLFSNKYMNEIIKVEPYGISNYIYIHSKNFIDEKARAVLSLMSNPGDLIGFFSKTDMYYGVSDYFETSEKIFFRICVGNSIAFLVHSKLDGTTKIANFPENDLLFKEGPISLSLMLLFGGASKEGVYYHIWPRDIARLRLLAEDGMLVDDLVGLDKLKVLEDDANPVVFYYRFK